MESFVHVAGKLVDNNTMLIIKSAINVFILISLLAIKVLFAPFSNTPHSKA